MRECVDGQSRSQGRREHTLMVLEETGWGVRTTHGLDLCIRHADVARIEQNGGGVGVLLRLDDFVVGPRVDVCGGDVG